MSDEEVSHVAEVMPNTERGSSRPRTQALPDKPTTPEGWQDGVDAAQLRLPAESAASPGTRR